MSDASAASIVNALVDTNVAIDWLNDRKPWSDEARPLWQSRDDGRVAVYLPASVLTDIFYILRKPLGYSGAGQVIERCVATFGLLPVDASVVRKALELPGSDFEDNVQIACSLIYPVDMIVTRNPDDFRQGVTVPVIDPKDILAHLPPYPTS
ncbi:MAG TPA: PIN domain-containing protein [Ktedonobacterales bacterium]